MQPFECIRIQVNELILRGIGINVPECLDIIKEDHDRLRYLALKFRFECGIQVEDIDEFVLTKIEDFRRRHDSIIEQQKTAVTLHADGVGAMIPLMYHPHGHTIYDRYMTHISSKWNDHTAIERLHMECSKIFSFLPARDANTDRLGLVIGQVQSGKTSCYNGVVCAALDAGYNTIIILSGKTENLRRQTQKRFEVDVLESQPDGEPDNVRSRFRALTYSDTTGMTRTPVNNMFNGIIAVPQNIVYGVFLKNGTVLKNLNEYLSQLNPLYKERIRALIIDDECDEATPNVRLKNPPPSVINGRIKSLRLNGLSRATYIGYTATPFANILNETGIDTLYPKTFIHIMSKPNKYFASDNLFGDSDLIEDEDNEPRIDIVRIIPDSELRRIQDSPSLRDAILWYACATAARICMGHTGFSTMLIHTSSLTRNHRSIARIVTKKIEEWRNNIDDFINSCIRVWNYEKGKVTPDKFILSFPEYGYEANELPEWPQIEQALVNEFLPNVVVKIDNSRIADDQRLKYESDSPKLQIAIGGNTMSRGLTLEDLVCSYFGRDVSSYDTLLQMGRWFGYRIGYETLPRIWMTAVLRDGFMDLVSIEKDMKREIRANYDLGNTPENVATRIKYKPSFAITRKQAILNAKIVGISYSRQSVQTIIFENNLDQLVHNWEMTEKFIMNIVRKGLTPDPDISPDIVFRNVEVEDILSYMGSYISFERSIRFRRNAIIEYIRQHADSHNYWTVAIKGKTDARTIATIGGFENGLINRSRLKNYPHDDGANGGDRINIKALMSPSDFLLDRPDLNVNSPADREAVFKIRDENNLNSLLIIYPIDSQSQPPRDSVERVPLNAAHHIIGIGMIIKDSSRTDRQPYIVLEPDYGFPKGEIADDDY